ncbi:hypothetical protein, partial [Heyndrickxia coagulans]|nr:hypothetical protein [Heyndrickxia coagulans]
VMHVVTGLFFHYQFQWQIAHSFSYFSVLFQRTLALFSSEFYYLQFANLIRHFPVVQVLFIDLADDPNS